LTPPRSSIPKKTGAVEHRKPMMLTIFLSHQMLFAILSAACTNNADVALLVAVSFLVSFVVVEEAMTLRIIQNK